MKRQTETGQRGKSTKKNEEGLQADPHKGRILTGDPFLTSNNWENTCLARNRHQRGVHLQLLCLVAPQKFKRRQSRRVIYALTASALF